MFADARTVPTGTSLEADICIIGAGAAGITLAREYIDSQFRVAVLESGDFKYDAKTQELYDGPIIGLPYFPLTAARLRYFGGTTNHWGGVCRRLADADFEPRAGIRFTGWPISRADLEPFYGPAADICQVPTKEWNLDTWLRRDRFSALPLDSNRIVTRVVQLVPESARSFGKRYRSALRQARNVTVYLHANVTEVQTDRAGTSATSVRVATLSGKRFFVRARLFVLAVGGIENPRLLLASNERWPNGIGNQNDLVGRFFSEHPRFVAGRIVPTDPAMDVGFYESHNVGDARIRAYLATSKDIQLAEGLLDTQIRLTPVYTDTFTKAAESEEVAVLRAALGSSSDEPLPDLGQHLIKVLADLSSWEKFCIPGAPLPVPYPEVIEELAQSTHVEAEKLIPVLLGDIAAAAYLEYFGAPVKSLIVTTRIEQAPNPDSRVQLIAVRDELGMRRVALDWRLSDIDWRNMQRALQILGTEVGRTGLGRLKILYEEDEPNWPEDLAGGWHLMGTTRMHDDPKRGVVDRNCRVHGMSNLFVAGSSVFPTAGSGTPTLTLVALTLRLAKHLRGELR
jgi:choline dehydrogenase-like flavoprotein